MKPNKNSIVSNRNVKKRETRKKSKYSFGTTERFKFHYPCWKEDTWSPKEFIYPERRVSPPSTDSKLIFTYNSENHQFDSTPSRKDPIMRMYTLCKKLPDLAKPPSMPIHYKPNEIEDFISKLSETVNFRGKNAKNKNLDNQNLQKSLRLRIYFLWVIFALSIGIVVLLYILTHLEAILLLFILVLGGVHYLHKFVIARYSVRINLDIDETIYSTINSLLKEENNKLTKSSRHNGELCFWELGSGVFWIILNVLTDPRHLSPPTQKRISFIGPMKSPLTFIHVDSESSESSSFSLRTFDEVKKAGEVLVNMKEKYQDLKYPSIKSRLLQTTKASGMDRIETQDLENPERIMINLSPQHC